MQESLIQFLKRRPGATPFRRDGDVRLFLDTALGPRGDLLPPPLKVFPADQQQEHSYGYPMLRAAALDDLEKRFERWIAAELGGGEGSESLDSYVTHLAKLSKNASRSSVLADYHSVFWLVHTGQTSRVIAAALRRGIEAGLSRDDVDRARYALHGKWATAVREALEPAGFQEAVLGNPLLAWEEFVSPDLRELRGYVAGYLHLDYARFRQAWDRLRDAAEEVLASDRVLRRALTLLGYPDSASPHLLSLLDERVWELLTAHRTFGAAEELRTISQITPRLLEMLVVQHLRRGILWMKASADGETVTDESTGMLFARGTRPLNFGRSGVVEPIVYRYGLVYDITSFTETLGEIARGGKGEENHSYRQMVEFQRELAELTRRDGLQFEKFLGDGAFYTSRSPMRSVQAAVAIQRFYSSVRSRGFAFNKGMRIALNYGYYRLLPMQVSTEGTQIMEFYGPGIVELSRLTTGKTTREIEDIQHLLVAHGYDQNEVYRFFAPLARSVGRGDAAGGQREFYAYVNENGHLINEGIVVSIPFLRELSAELKEEEQKLYRLRTPWGVYLGFRSEGDGGYAGIRLLGSVSLKGIGSQEVGEIVSLSAEETEISMIDEPKPLLQLLQQERNRSAASDVRTSTSDEIDAGLTDLVVCATGDSAPVILVGEWDPVSDEVRRPIRLDDVEAERYGLAVPLTAQGVEAQSLAYQKLYQKLSRIETLPSFSVRAIRDNANFNGFIIGATVEPL